MRCSKCDGLYHLGAECSFANMIKSKSTAVQSLQEEEDNETYLGDIIDPLVVADTVHVPQVSLAIGAELSASANQSNTHENTEVINEAISFSILNSFLYFYYLFLI